MLKKIPTLLPLQSALNVSEYTDSVDTLSRRPKSQRIVEGLRDMASVASGLYVCADLRKVGPQQLYPLSPTPFAHKSSLAHLAR